MIHTRRAATLAAPIAIVLVFVAIALIITYRSSSNTTAINNTSSTTPDTTSESSATPWFVDAADNAGLSFVYEPGPKRHWFPEIMGGGVCLIDYDKDSYLDIYFVQGGDLDPEANNTHGNVMYRNLGPDKVLQIAGSGGERALRFEDVTDKTKVGDTGYGMGCTVGDFDADGWDDIYVTNVGQNTLYRNNQDGTFSNITDSAGVGDERWGASAAFLDFDRDGLLDLFVVNYVGWSIKRNLECFSGAGERQFCSPNNYNAPVADNLYRNNGDGTFTDVAEAAGIGQVFGNGLGVACADFDANGWVDIYVANDGMANQLWLNQGDGTFVDEALLSGSAVNVRGKTEAGMGVQAVDVDDDGDMDIFLSHLRNESNTFYVNDGGWFDDMTARMGLAATSIDLTGFGLAFEDFNNDGYQDLYIVNGRVVRWEPTVSKDDPYAEPNLLFAAKGAKEGTSFQEVSPPGGTPDNLIFTSRAMATGDLDNDGGVDAVVVNRSAPANLLRNVVNHRGRWVSFDVRLADGSVALYAMVSMETGGRKQSRMVQRAYSYCASGDARVHFGIGSADKIDRVTVKWPGESKPDTFGPFKINHIYTLTQNR